MIQPVRLYNTMGRSVQTLRPGQPDRVGIYTCGPTVYGDPHVGNYRTYIFEDVLVKTLRYLGYQVEWVMNVTDVGHLILEDQDSGEDKLEVGARREGTTAWEVAKKYEAIFLRDMETLHCARPDRLVRATDTIAEQIALIQQLEAKGFTYQIEDGIYFDSTKVPDYGKLARLDIAGLQAGARVDMQAGKRHLTDFALWKFSPPGRKRDMEWESPWGKGFPGWHIECSAIALKELGDGLDIHCGGVDHIPVHHTNEIAQSEAATGRPFARHWSHAEHLLIDGGKISKSLGNGYTLQDLAERGIEPLALRLFCFSASYRTKLNFTWEALQAAQVSLRHLRHLTSLLNTASGGAGSLESYLERYWEAVADDLNLPVAVALLFEVLRSDLSGGLKRQFVQEAEQVLSLDLFKEEEIPAQVATLAQERETFRQQKDWPAADRLRQEIEGLGYQVLDGTSEGKYRIIRLHSTEGLTK